MKKLLILSWMALAIIATSCRKNEDCQNKFKEGSYTGTFNRASPNERFTQSQVTLKLEKGAFTGTSSADRYPAICEGTYTVSGQEIEFSNTCRYTADFDWTLILDGKYTWTANGNSLTLTRKQAEGVYDTYELTRQ